jgi:hypothetical protein
MKYKCLFVDDEEKYLKMMKGVIVRRWDEEFGGSELEVEPADFDTAEELLEKEPSRFHLVITDLMERDPDQELEPRGFGIVEVAASHSIALIALTRYTDEGGPAADVGAVLVSKERLRRDTRGDYLRENLREAARCVGLDPLPTEQIEVKVEDGLYLAASLHTVGIDVLKALVVKLVGEVDGIQVGFVRSGLSGATVFRCTVDLHRETGNYKRDLLLKVSRDGAAITLEANRQSEEVPAFSGALFPPAVGNAPVEHKGWFAIATEYAEGGKTLADWLKSDPSGEHVGEALESLFLGPALAAGYAYSREEITDASALDLVLDHTLGLSRKARIRLAARTLAPLAIEHGGAGEDLLQTVDTFLESGRVAERDRDTVARGTVDVRAHGDLHARNVIVGNNRRAILIDPANIDRQHWPADWARLAVDVFLGGLDGTGDGVRAYDWDLLKQWVEMGDSLVGLSVEGMSALPDAPRAALGWLLGSVGEIYGEVLGPENELPVGELQLALAAELLRGAYRVQAFTAPVRTLGLIAGSHALGTAAVSLPRRNDDRAAA